MPRITIVAAAVVVLPLALLLSRVSPGPAAAPASRPRPAAPAPPPEPPLAEPERPPLDFAPMSLEDDPEPGEPPATVSKAQRPPAPRRPPAPKRPRATPRKARRAPPSLRAVVDADGDGLVGAVNLNTASLAELVLLPGMGPKRAKAVVEYRERRRLTHSRQVTRVRGIGPRTYRRWRSHIKVHGDNTLRRLGGKGAKRRRSRS